MSNPNCQLIDFIIARTRTVNAAMLEIDFVLRDLDEQQREEVRKAIANAVINPKSAFAPNRMKHRITRAVVLQGLWAAG